MRRGAKARKATEAKYNERNERKRMRKTNKNLTKQLLTLMLAFIMVFTGMGIGSWGVDQAWAAEEDSFSQIAKINYTVYDRYGNITTAYSFATDNERHTATAKTANTTRSLNKISERITLIDEEEKPIEFDNISITLDGAETNKWTWKKANPTELKLTITIGGKMEEYMISFTYEAPYFTRLFYNYGQWMNFYYQVDVDEYKDTGGTGLTVTENVAKASELKLEGCTGKILAIESDYCEPKDSCATINSDVSAVVNWYKANGEIRITISNSDDDTDRQDFYR